MQVQKIFSRSTQKSSISSNIYQNNPLPKQSLKVSFKGGKDSFNFQDNENLLKQVQGDLNKITREMTSHKNYETPRDEMFALENRAYKLATIRGQYKLIGEALSSSLNKNLTDKNTKSILKFIQAMTRLKKNEGFGRIIGTQYAEIKQSLIDKFVLQTVGKAKISKDVKVPNAVFFYGPPGTGKTTFAQALAEQSCSNIDLVDAGKISPEEALAQIKQKALIAKANYTKSGEDKKRTFIVVNEADAIALRGSDSSSDFIKFAQTCSEKYKCTLFLTTNAPLDIDPEILSDEITPIKVALFQANKQTAKEISEYTLKRFNQPIAHSREIVEAYFSNPKALYSNSDIVKTIEQTCAKTQGAPVIQDYLNTIKNYMPSVPNKIIASFPKNNAELIEMAKKIK